MKKKLTPTPDGDGDDRVEDPLPELVEMLQKRHLPAGEVVVLVVFRRELERPRLGAREGHERHGADA